MSQPVSPVESNFTPAYPRRLDACDPLAGFRANFIIADQDLLYMDGNSLGRLPVASMARLQQAVQSEWGSQLIRSWGEDWYAAPQRIGDKIGQVIGAAPGQVVVCDSTSVNLFKLVMAALPLRPGRQKIVSDAFNFPTDLYVLQGCLQSIGPGASLDVIPSRDGISIDQADILAAVDQQTALVVLSHAAFKSGFLYDMAAITAAAHQQGALVIWDLSHSAGAVPIQLDTCEVDFAVGCTYKYLNGGPGAPAYLYVNSRWQELVQSPIWGWFGQKHPFAFELEYQPAAGIQRFLSGTPPVLSMLAVEPGVDLILKASLPAIRQKSVLLTGYLIDLFDHFLAPLGFNLGTPRQPDQRGSHVSIRHPMGYQINQALIEEMKVIPDFREPDNIRLGLAPLYTSFEDVYESIQRIRKVMVEERYATYSADRQTIT